MSTPSITAPGHMPREQHRTREGGPREALRRLVRGREADPVWSRPLLWLVAAMAGVLTLWGLTRNGYANTYYAEAAQAASHSWKAWFTNALDVSGSDSLDKGPLSNMLMGLSGRVFGFSSFSMLLPEALCGIASVLVLHDIVKRTLGHRAAILAAGILTLTPIFVAMSRFNNPDSILVLTEIGAAWALVRALQSGRTRHLLLCGLFIGLAFNVKMLAAYLIVPGLALTFLIAGQGGLRRRSAQLTAGAVAMLATSFAWYGAMMLLPTADRPWVGDTTDDSWFSLIFGANGLSRVDGNGGGGPSGGGGFGGAEGPLRLFNSIVGGQIAWLLPLALVGLLLGLWTLRRAPRTDLGRSAYLLWGGWGLISWAIFSFSKGVFHPYYTTALAPAVAVLSAGGLTVLWDRSRSSTAWAAALAAVLFGTVALAVTLLDRASGFAPWLAPTLIALAVLAGAALLLGRLPDGWGERTQSRIAAFAAFVGVIAVLAAPASYSIATVGKTLTGSNPLAGPSSAEAGAGFGGAPGAGVPGGLGRGGAGGVGGAPPGALRTGGPPPGAPQGASPRAFSAPAGSPPSGIGAGAGALGARGTRSAGGAPGGANVSQTLVKYLERHQGTSKYLLAAVGSSTAGTIAVQSGRNVIDMGGFTGSDPAPSLAKLKALVASGQLHYVLLDSGMGGGMGAPGGGPGGSSAATQARDAWIKSHGTLVKLAGQSATAGATLYHLSSASAR
jgi:4-amino-4-deoxy-L-arabinose transferase-like glycosyltransferase